MPYIYMTSAPAIKIKTIAASRHLILLGDSIFDNYPYVPNGTAVIDHLRQLVPAPWRATLLAHDGDVVADVGRQLSKVPKDASHVVISIGGNDALRAKANMATRVSNIAEALVHLAEVRQAFRQAYQQMLQQAVSLGRQLAVCTIYDAIPGLPPETQTVLALFNDTIVREAYAAQVPVIDLRQICRADEDYSSLSPIEPSSLGGYRIAMAIADWIGVGFGTIMDERVIVFDSNNRPIKSIAWIQIKNKDDAIDTVKAAIYQCNIYRDKNPEAWRMHDVIDDLYGVIDFLTETKLV